jgi:hypothetical protein
MIYGIQPFTPRERADSMSGRVPREIERLVLSEATEMHLELAAAGLL